MFERVIRLRPYEYVHILDNNTCEVHLVEGPQCFTLLDHHVKLHSTVQRHIVIPTNHYCECVQSDGHRTVRLSGPPFPLRPGETASEVRPLRVLTAREAIVLHVLADYIYRDANTGEERRRIAGERWLMQGPGVYIPRVEEEVLQSVEPVIIPIDGALLMQATCDFTEVDGTRRSLGEVWLVRKPRMYFPNPNTKVLNFLIGKVLSPKLALHVRALNSFYDVHYKKERVAGERWLVTHDVTPMFLPSEHEEIVEPVKLTILRWGQYCVVSNIVRDGICHYGERELRKGPCSFLLQPDESLLDGEIKDAYLLGAHEALLVEALTTFTDEEKEERIISSRWLVHGPCSYIPPLEVRVLERRKRMLLSGDKGVYVRNIRTGRITAMHGQALMLSEDEVLWEKPIDPLVCRLLASQQLSVYDINASSLAAGEETQTTHHVISCKVPHNALIQLYDSSKNTSRVEAGPAAVFLEPNDEFTPISLSGGRPKVPNCIHSLCLFLGPDFMADIIEVETLDHARLALNLAYNWEFDTSDRERIKRIAFAVPDFVGRACMTLANRIRVAIAGETFDNFHRNSSSLIRQAIFKNVSGATELRGDSLYFPVNGLVITNVDVHSVEPVELNTRNALKKSVQLAVEIITKSQENEASHQAMLLEQEAKGALELQLMKDKASAEAERITLLEVSAANNIIELSGASKAQALAESESRLVELQGEVDVTGTRCEAQEVMANAELEIQRERMELDLAHRRAMNEIAVKKVQTLADIEATKFENIMNALGRATIEAMARAGPELKSKLLQALGLKGFLLTDGTAPINLLGMADRVVQERPATKP
ncbi:putative major vault protein [Trypanosoma theileri]|uniref:Putative major vault protein n=1 Tax=Trypanosoma theileri TaxID=67003 RepID=A0A1X0NXD4_9TRYP|nr:putative major vault protein [Trypanosoma theileri]ORC89355.1 putative major vault protein [Trypanosoma theileri]